MSDLYFDMNDLFEAVLMTKTADYKLSKTPAEWQQEITAILYNSHPWFSTEDLKFDVRKMDPAEGTAVGSIIVEGNLYIPIIVSDFKLKPLDLYIHKGKVKLLTQKNFFEDSVGKDIGTVTKNVHGAKNNESLWSKVYSPYTGRLALASFEDTNAFKTYIEKNFSHDQFKVACVHNPFLKAVIKDYLTANYTEKKAAAPVEVLPEWKAMRISLSDMPKNFDGVGYVFKGAEKIACFIGHKIVTPGEKVMESKIFGIEANVDKPRYFVIPSSTDIAFEPAVSIDDFSLVKHASYSDKKLQNAYLATDETSGELILVGPFSSVGFDASTQLEKVATMSGNSYLIDTPEFKKCLSLFSDTTCVGNQSIRLTLGEMFTPDSSPIINSEKLANLYNNVRITKVYPVKLASGKIVATRDRVNYDEIDTIVEGLKKVATMTEALETAIKSRLNDEHPVVIYQEAPAVKQASAPTIKLGHVTFNVDPTIALTSAFINRTISVDAKAKMLQAFPMLKQAAQLNGENEGEVKATVDSILSLNSIDSDTVQNFLEKRTVIEDSEQTCANLLLMSRLGFPLEEAPCKAALMNLDEIANKLRIIESLQKENMESVV